MKLVSVEQMRAIEQAADARGVSYARMMQLAGSGVAEVLENFAENDAAHPPVVVGLVGSGNNGGDTLVALSRLALAGWMAYAYMVSPRPKGDTLLPVCVRSGVAAQLMEDDSAYLWLGEQLAKADYVLDGILGTGARLPLKAELAAVLKFVQGQLMDTQMVVAVDCPSGVDCDSGACAAETLPAHMTICMAAIKRGLLNYPAFGRVGILTCVDIGLPDDLPEWQQVRDGVVDWPAAWGALPQRDPLSHKGSHGTAMIVAGSLNFTGAALLAGRAAYAVGTGLVRMAVPGGLHAVLAGHLAEATWLLLPQEDGVIAEAAHEVLRKNLDKVSALLIGPGLGTEETTAAFLRSLLEKPNQHAARGGLGFLPAAQGAVGAPAAPGLPPLVVDADGLKLLAQITDWPQQLPPRTVLTPHPGEFAVLTGLSVADIQQDRLELARTYARQWGHVVVLKGAGTIVADPSGVVQAIPVATSALAKAGTGDVLAGIIVGLLAQGLDAFDAAWLGAYLHAQAGVTAAHLRGEVSVLAGDIIAALPEQWPD